MLGASRVKELALALAVSGTIGAAVALVGAVERNAPAQEHTDQAEVVAKVWQPGGALLSKGYFQLDDNKVWQPLEDAPGSSRQLILQVAGQPVAIAVSPQVYEQYCQRAEMGVLGGHNNPAHMGNCGANHEMGKPAPAPIPLDTLQVSYTQDKDGTVHVTSIEGMEQLATGFMERYRLRKEFDKQKELGDVQYRQRDKGPVRG